MNTHEYFMKRALELAGRGWGRTNPNPLVGAVIVKNGKIISEGFHGIYGGLHAEADAIRNAKEDIKGSSLYVNLEPCCHYGKTPPCASAIINAGISEVFMAMVDPNPVVAGRGAEILKNAGIKVHEGILGNEAKKLNEIFIKYITKKRPFVIMKTAMTIDGKIAAASGDSKWISCESSREYVHIWRSRVMAVMAGINTVLADNPSLTVRLVGGGDNDPAAIKVGPVGIKTGDPAIKVKNPVRIIVDAEGRIPEDSKVINQDSQDSSGNVILAATSLITDAKERLLAEKGVRIIKAEGKPGRVDLEKLMDELYKLNIDSILLEGGGGLNASALEYGIVDKVMFFIAPKIIGGRNAVTPVEGAGIQLMKDAIKLEDVNVRRFGEDILVEGYI